MMFSLAKSAAILPVGFKHSPWLEKFESHNFKEIKFLHLYFIFATYLPREVDGRVIRFLGRVALKKYPGGSRILPKM